MNSERLDLGFIQRCMSPEIQQQVIKWNKFWIWKHNKYQRDNPEKQRDQNRKYSKSEKGIASRRKAGTLRRMRERILSEGLSKEESKQIRNFYADCPKGFSVDHIYPIALGGIHRIGNLQYMPLHENRKKHSNIEGDIDFELKANLEKKLKSLNHISIPYLQRILKCSYEDAEKEFHRLNAEKNEVITLRAFQNKKMCPECLKTYPKTYKVCETCPNDAVRVENNKMENRLKWLGLVK